jgi:hypothetical protein
MKFVSPTLLDSMQWLKTCPPMWKEAAYESLENTLSRKPFEMNVYAKRGINFEKKIRLYSGHNKLSIYIRDVVETMSYQQSYYEDIIINGNKFRIGGRVDFIDNNKIIDLKTTAKTKKKTKKIYYSKGHQHKWYSCLFNKKEFKYIIAHLGDNMENLEPYEVSVFDCSIDYTREEIRNDIVNFLEDLNMIGLLELYYDSYCKNY